MRNCIGWDKTMMVDANQKWGVQQVLYNMKCIFFNLERSLIYDYDSFLRIEDKFLNLCYQLSQKRRIACRDVLFEYHRAVVPICLAVRPVRSLSTL